jgi:hypothetical protein
MNRIEIANWKKDPSVAAIVAATFPDYRRKTVTIRAAENVTLYDLNWSGGTRAEYRACTLDGKAAGNTDRYNHVAPWQNAAEGASVPIPSGMVVVRGGHFCGKPSLLTIHVNPADMPKYLAKAEG